MRVGPTALKVAGAAGALVACGASALAVASDSKPPGAPLKPPVSGVAAAPPAPPVDTTGLVIPPTTTCAGGAAPAPPASIAAAVKQVQAATAGKERQAVLAALPADQRTQVTAYLQTAAAARKQPRGKGTGPLAGLGCLGSGAGGSSGDATPIAPSVVAGQAGAPIIVSAVS